MAKGKKTGGRRKGTPNKVTGAFKEAVALCYEEIGGIRTFKKWATRNQTEFYKIAARLIPHEIAGSADGSALPLRIELTDAPPSRTESGL